MYLYKLGLRPLYSLFILSRQLVKPIKADDHVIEIIFKRYKVLEKQYLKNYFGYF